MDDLKKLHTWILKHSLLQSVFLGFVFHDIMSKTASCSHRNNHTAQQIHEYDATYPRMFLRMLKHSLNHLLFSRNKKQMKTKPCESNVKTKVKIWQVYPCEWMFVSWSRVLARAAKPVVNLPPRICPSPSLPPSVRPSHWTNERVRGERRTGGREGEAVLIPHNHICWRHCMFPLRLIGYSVSQKCFCYTTTKLQVLKLRFPPAQQMQTNIFSWRCSLLQ